MLTTYTHKFANIFNNPKQKGLKIQTCKIIDLWWMILQKVVAIFIPNIRINPESVFKLTIFNF